MKLMMTSLKCGPTKVGGIRGYEENYDSQPTLVPPCMSSCMLQWRIPISGDPISSFFCMLQELAIDQFNSEICCYPCFQFHIFINIFDYGI
jgi:hypothetical protein